MQNGRVRPPMRRSFDSTFGSAQDDSCLFAAPTKVREERSSGRGCYAFLCGDPSTPPSAPLRMTVVCLPHRRRSVYTVQAGGVISASRNVPSSTGLCGKMLRCRADFTVRKAPPMGELSAKLTERAFHGESAAFALSPAIAGALPRGEP